ncbi:AraC family transcriptional regulator [Pseudomonas syringae pv. aceris str. M302273]|nr:AraC family transcriptional regulator [Pseudomonas syringae pv. aceris str. M302273]
MVAESSAPHRYWERTSQHVRQHPDEDLLAIYVATGSANMTQAGRLTVLGAGDIALYDAGKPFKHEFYSDSVFSMRIPRTLMFSRFPESESLMNVKIAENQPMSLLLGQMLEQACAISTSASDNAKARFASSFLDAMSASLEIQTQQDLGSDRPHCYSTLFGKAVRFVEQQLDNCEISAEDIAAALHVSQRTLSRAFAKQNTTLMNYLWARRLESSHALLLEGRVQQVTQAAQQCGFSDLSHYCRAFKKRYGSSPSSLLTRSHATYSA